jgi:hypothetical protein
MQDANTTPKGSCLLYNKIILTLVNPVMAISSTFTFSQSSLQDYSDCPRRFDLRYIQRLQWPAVESEPVLENERHQQEGQLFHRLVQQHLIGIPEAKLTPLASSPDLRQWWDNYLGADLGLEGMTKFTELSLSAPIAGFRLIAKCDLIAAGADKIVIVDWKTYHKRPRNDWMAARLQTRVYRALLVNAGAHLHNGSPIQPERVEMVYWYASQPHEPARFPYTAAQYTRDWAVLEKMISEIAGAVEFPLTTDLPACKFCVYRSFCDRGLAAGTGEDTESELNEPELNFEQVQEIAF